MTQPTLTNFSTVNQHNKDQGSRLEKVASLFTGLDTTPGSGCGLLFKGDLHSASWIVEVKSTRKSTLRFDMSWWSKLIAQAKEKHKPHYGLLLGWVDRPAGFTGNLQYGCLPDSSDFGAPDYVLTCKRTTVTLPSDYLTSMTESGICVFTTVGRVRILPLTTFIKYVQNHSD